MIHIILLILLAAYFVIISQWQNAYAPQKRTLSITEALSRIICIAPLFAFVIFAILFTFVLRGQLEERAAHACLVLILWMYATRFYQYLLAHYKNQRLLLASLIGMLFSVIMAMLLTSLDRYIGLLYSHMQWYSVFLTIALYGVFYITAVLHKKRKKR